MLEADALSVIENYLLAIAESSGGVDTHDMIVESALLVTEMLDLILLEDADLTTMH